MKNYWIPVEQEWRAKHLHLLRPHLDCVARAHEWLAGIARHSDVVEAPADDVLGVSRLLLRRLGEELRAVEILASEGHGFQSAATASNLFEQSHYLTYVGITPENAKRFIEWTEPTASIISVKQLVKVTGAAHGWSDDRSNEEYAKYRFLCGFKHNNPVFQRILLLPIDPDLYMGQYAISESVWSCAVAVGEFAVRFLKAASLNSSLDELNGIMEEVEQLFPTLPEGSLR